MFVKWLWSTKPNLQAMLAMESLELLSNRVAIDSLTELTYRQGDNPTARESFCENSCGPRPMVAARSCTLNPNSICSSEPADFLQFGVTQCPRRGTTGRAFRVVPENVTCQNVSDRFNVESAEPVRRRKVAQDRGRALLKHAVPKMPQSADFEMPAANAYGGSFPRSS